MESRELQSIRLRGARQNNLRGIDLDLPLGQLIVVTGLSGAGKSSLVFDTLHAEGQRRYVETFSPYTRQFLEMLDRPKVDSIENIRPSIAIRQSNTVKTSRSTVGTMTELCDYFKVWFSHAAQLIDPASGEPLTDDNPQTIWRDAHQRFAGQNVLLTFGLTRPGKLKWAQIVEPLAAQGFTRTVIDGEIRRLDEIDPDTLSPDARLDVVADKFTLKEDARARFIEAATNALRHGKGRLELRPLNGRQAGEPVAYTQGLCSPVTGEHFAPAAPNRFSFNSPVGACPRCRGFGRVIEIDDKLVIPDETLSLADGAIKAFTGDVYSESLRDLGRVAKKHGVPMDVPWRELTDAQRAFVMEGEPGYGENGREWPKAWYGVRRFFQWLEGNLYKMHVRVFLSRFRSYTECPDCHGARLKPEALHWRWQGRTLPELYRMPVGQLHALLQRADHPGDPKPARLAWQNILARLGYLNAVGLGYLTLDRSSRTLSGGETQRVNLTACLGASLVDTLFILDEPSIGLHARDIDRLTGILRGLVDQGNTVVVVEHDEAVMRAADWLVEIGPRPGKHGGEVVYTGPARGVSRAKESVTGRYLSGAATIEPPASRRKINAKTPALLFKGVTKHNLADASVTLPLNRFVALSGVSGSGKSTLLDNVIHQGLLTLRGKACEDPARIKSVAGETLVGEIVWVNQGPVSKTPRSNPALYAEVWDAIRTGFALTEAARQAGLTASHFSFNAGNGRCEHCQGLGFERVEMQFLSDLYVPCPVCEGKRFKPEVLAIRWKDLSVADTLALTIDEALGHFAGQSRITRPLEALAAVGLGYLTLGQPLNTLSGGESQRLKLVKHLTGTGKGKEDAPPALLLLDEPTTGLHRDDVKRLIAVLQRLVDQGHSLVVIEHQTDVLRAADWLIELGPGAGADGGQVVFAGTPEDAAQADTETARYLKNGKPGKVVSFAAQSEELEAAEPVVPFRGNTPPPIQDASGQRKSEIQIIGAREHNLRDISINIPHDAFNVVTGVSGSGKSTLAFDIVFAEGQRRFMESMSSYARQFVEQLPRPDIDDLRGIPPTVAIEQRITRGTRKSTVATITEVAQYLRLLFPKVGVQHSPVTGEPVSGQSESALRQRLLDAIGQTTATRSKTLFLCAPLVRSRKGHHQPLADWASDHGYQWLRCDGKLVPVAKFKKLDRYREHDIELAWDLGAKNKRAARADEWLDDVLKRGQGACFLLGDDAVMGWFSTRRTDPATGEAFPELDPKHFSWNSPQGWCPTCRGHGHLYDWMREHEDYEAVPDDVPDGELCPDCHGTRLNRVSRAVRIAVKKSAAKHLADPARASVSLPELLALPPEGLLGVTRGLKLDARGKIIAAEILPEIEERLRFMDRVGLGYLTLDRATATLSGGEAQRIRLAAQLGSNLAGVLYVLDEPSIGLHARDNDELIASLRQLRDQGNTLLVVEHDEDTMRAADHIIDLGPGAGKHGGEILAAGSYQEITKAEKSLTGRLLRDGIPHPLRGAYRDLPKPWNPRSRAKEPEWLVLKEPRLRNLKGGELRLPLSRLTMVVGVSGAGKSTLIRDLLRPAVEQAITGKANKLSGSPDAFKELRHGDAFHRVIEVDQSPIGKTPRSTPATYIGAFDIIREQFAALPEAKMRGLKPGAFSFNTKGGRCETCQGAGRVKLEMAFMPDSYQPCDDCGGRRYGAELLEIQWNGRSIADVLEMTFEEAREFFHFHSRLSDLTGLMVETGLGYLTLGQSSPTLSGGEAQRLKLVSELAHGLPSFKEKSQAIFRRNLYILEEPTIGLHLSDCARLIELLHSLVDQEHTVVVVEHNLDLVAEGDYVVEVGPQGGASGGEILFQGPVRKLLAVKNSPTAPYLKKLLK